MCADSTTSSIYIANNQGEVIKLTLKKGSELNVYLELSKRYKYDHQAQSVTMSIEQGLVFLVQKESTLLRFVMLDDDLNQVSSLT